MKFAELVSQVNTLLTNTPQHEKQLVMNAEAVAFDPDTNEVLKIVKVRRDLYGKVVLVLDRN